ncbi:MAG: bifunctional glutamate N-acetyltransferase/amino-acid acetyltransferase ArgJ [Candidatus Omnitrophica bacterium]|nr:bifunctional glutamate N-acetyltransferase/amino-acid acetyltransferase ArgJ [Candidatus Omnitrophota bacterium]
MKVFKKAILPLKFKANAVACGIKRKNRLDLALFYSEVPAKAAVKFTSNKIQAAPLQLAKNNLKLNCNFQAIIANSGNANCFTGKPGLKDAQETQSILANELGIKKEAIFVSSTGVIGKRLQIDKIKIGVPEVVKGLSISGIDKAKKAIMTTDTFTKELTAKLKLGGKIVTICGVAKGAGMIAPDMATMLCYIFTDIEISKKLLEQALDTAVENSFNCITVDGCMSTNDTVIVLANGAAGNKPVNASGMDYKEFSDGVNLICLELAKMMVQDAEGATKFIQIKVAGARNARDAKKAALAIANSNLFKCAVYGENPNFGRIVAAVGASGAEVKEECFRVKVSDLKKKNINVDVDLNIGKSEAVVYSSDLTPEYIRINAEYN